MAWDFETDPQFQSQLDWMNEFVRSSVEPLEQVLGEYKATDERFPTYHLPRVRERAKMLYGDQLEDMQQIL